MRGRELGRSGLGGAGGIPGQGRVLPSPARTRQPPRCRLLFLLLCSAQAAEAFGVFLNWFSWFCPVPPCSPRAASSASQNHDFTGFLSLFPVTQRPV